MGPGFNHFVFAVLVGLAPLLLVHAQDKSDFISIDCGLPANSSYTLQTTGVNYVPDETFTDGGVSKSITSGLRTGNQQNVWYLRSFPQGVRNCYTINITEGTQYLIRTIFLYGNYDRGSNFPQFDLYLGANMWDTVKIRNASTIVIKELIQMASQNYIHVCLVNTGLGTPFVSSIELRPLKNTTYNTASGSLSLFLRLDVGSITNQSYGYGYDVYDRLWSPSNFDKWDVLSTSLTLNSQTDDDFHPPSVVMSSAATPTNTSAPLEFYWNPDDPTTSYYIYMHFAEVVKLKANQSRSFNISVNGKFFYGPVVPDYFSVSTVYSTSAISGGDQILFSLTQTESSTLPPIVNALEVFSVKYLLQSESNQRDADAITKVKSTYGIKRNWQGDPCAPEAFSWEGLNCSYDRFNPPRIISLNLSSSGLTGEISTALSNLLLLQYLDLSNNNLTGSVPDFLSRLPYLRVLNLERNQLTGSVPAGLIARASNGSLSLSVDGYIPNLCGSGSCKKKNSPVVPLIVASVGALFVLSLIVAAILLKRRRRRKRGTTKLVETVDTESNTGKVQIDGRIEPIQRKFSYSELLEITDNFKTVLGKGGFGEVYHGFIDDTQVAVKMISSSSVHGYQQFESEVKSLMRVHHRNLTALVGYCYEGKFMGLVYEYMANKDLQAHLSGKNPNVLSWEERLRIVADAAQGLEYMHCSYWEPIVHRDIKPANILLNENFQAKLADFGLSRIFPTGGSSHVTTVVAGTPGYLDPEYSTTSCLTEKSDVYSFGVVILVTITGRPAIESHEHVSHWVSSMLAKGNIKNIVDPRLRGNFDVNSAWRAVEIAMACVSPTFSERPTMTQVVAELKECSAAEQLSRSNEGAGLRERTKEFS